MKSVRFPDGISVPALGQGTWRMSEDRRRRAEEIRALRAGVDHGLLVIDTAEMYGDGATETLVGEALEGLRGKVFLVSKVLPGHASRSGVLEACEGSLRRLRTDVLDLYLLHWPGSIPLAETIAGFERLVSDGKIRRWGVSNFDEEDMKALATEGGGDCASNQILYNLTRRGPEFDLLPRLAREGVPAMAYSPVEQGRLAGHPELRRLASSLGATPAQLALAWLLRRDGIVAIPKAGSVAHVEENRAAADLVLHAGTLEALDGLFPPPRRKTPLAVL